ncbi:MAG: DNA topoisomerase III, partial [Clostridia bacterium]|nr:DNA topoisomerase III [Clostridia bacterium]
DQGNALITVLPDNIKSPKMTAEWEMELNQIAKGKEDSEQFMHGIERMIKDLVATYHAVADEKQTQFPIGEKHSLGTCPRCDSPVYEGKKNYYCSNRECKFALWKNDKFLESLGKKMDTGTVKKFLKSGRVTFKNLVSKKTGKSYQADIVLDDDKDGYVHFKMEFPNKK